MTIGFTLEEAFDLINMPALPRREIRTRYQEPHRDYHNLDHLREMLRWVPKNHPEVTSVLEAIFYHDIVHSSSPAPLGVNEALSCAEYVVYTFLGIYHLHSGLTPFGQEGKGSLLNERRVIEAITATAYHTEDQENLCDVAKLVLDLDLASFALPWEEYQVASQKVEKELSTVYGVDITEGRVAFLRKLIKRKKLYYIKTEWEDIAKDNINKTLGLYQF
jgi:predicted metal-dependent HD superfamily phosphohydrolase